MSLLDVIYSSAPASKVLIPTLEITSASFDPIRICAGYDDITATLESSGAQVVFYAGALSISLPEKNTTGQQVLNFAIDNVTGIAQQSIDAAIEAGNTITVTYRVYTNDDLYEPQETPIVMTLVGATFTSSTVQVQAAYFDLLNFAWPRLRYTLEFSPGLAYIS